MCKVFNIVDELGRLKDVKFVTSLEQKLLDNNGNQYQSHGLSYVGARELYKNMGIKMGLDYDNNEK